MNSNALPPSDVDSEAALLGACMLSEDSFHEVAGIVRESDFYDFRHRKIWSVLVEMRDAGLPIDPLSMGHELGNRGLLNEIGGASTIETLMDSVWAIHHAEHYAGIVTEMADRRRIQSAITDAARRLQTGVDAADVLASLSTDTDAIADRGGDDVVSLADAIAKFDEHRSREWNRIPTGWHDIDVVLDGGLAGGQLVVIAARTSVGKTAFAVRLAHHVSKRMPILFVSLEMGSTEIAARVCSMDSGVPVARLSQPGEWPHDAEVSRHALTQLPFSIDEKPGRTGAEIKAIARLRKRKHGLGLLVVDYIQLIEPADRRAPREQQIAQTTRSLKQLARELQVPVVALAQLNRGIEGREDKRPRLSDLRESGAIEQDSDVVVFLDRPATYDDSKTDDLAIATIAKNRGGRSGRVNLKWDGPTMLFANSIHDPF